ncbi:hypothetical protein M422DRAFT_180855, partial [Sphaerobolus stellatus SS14]
IISMMLYSRNRSANVFQLMYGLFLAGAGTSKRVIDTLCHMGLSVSYKTTQRALEGLTLRAKTQAQAFVKDSDRLSAVVYDNINITLRKANQRLDNMVQQLNATTCAVFSLPSKFTREKYGHFLSSAAQKRSPSEIKENLTMDTLIPDEGLQARIDVAFTHNIRMILLNYAPRIRKNNKCSRKLRKDAAHKKPTVRSLGHEKTLFYPLPAIDEEEASVRGTINVVKHIFLKLLEFTLDLVDVECRLMVGDWLTIRNLRLMKVELEDERSNFLTMQWVKEASMPFHFQINGIHMLFRTHFGHAGDNDPASLDAHRRILRRSTIDTKKPEFNRGRELVEHSLIARILDCARFIYTTFARTEAAHQAIRANDHVLGHSILFIRDALYHWELAEAIRDGDVAGLSNYANELLEMKQQYCYEFNVEFREIMESTWLVNRWGVKGRSIPTDLYLEHNNGFIKVFIKLLTYLLY